MKALILAAGVGQRLAVNHPKCLLRFGGQTLLERHIRSLRALGVDSLAIGVGYESQAIAAELASIGAQEFVSTVYNPDYTRGSILSLWTLKELLRQGEDMVLMDADVLYDGRILERLVTTPFLNCFLMDRNFEGGEEPVKLCVRGKQLVEFRKRLAPDLAYDYSGESVGFFRFSRSMAARLAERTEDYVQDGRLDEPYEEVIRDLLLESPEEFGFEDVTGLPWVEIDFPQDIERAQKEILPQINEP